MESSIYNIALDGPAGAGKSTVAKSLAKRLDILYLDTGAMYRALGLKAYDNKVNIHDEAAVKGLLDGACVDVKYKGGAQRTYLDKIDVSEKIREPHISRAASDISAVPAVRYAMVELQRKIAAQCSMVLDGRDIGTYVLPNAKFKFYITARPEVRADRRYKELIEKGQPAVYEEVLREMNVRDENDSKRAVAPLKQADDAVLIDTSDITAEQAVGIIIKRIEGRG
jgi:cytidylate kinase